MEFRDSTTDLEIDERDHEASVDNVQAMDLIPAEEHVMEEEDDESRTDRDENDELVILDPNHPLMQRVQAALNAQLAHQNEKLEIELREKIDTLRRLQTERENVGIELYGVQQHLARQQMLVEAEQDKHTATNQLRTRRDATLNQIRELYRSTVQQLSNERQETLKIRHEVETSATGLRYISEAHQTMKDDIAVTKRATEKITTNVSKAEGDKLQQDVFVEKLTSSIYSQEEQVALCDAQYIAQAQEAKAIREAITEASLELETVLLEKKRLLQQWNITLIGMRRRDEAYAAMMSATNTQHEQIKSLETELNNYKRNIIKEEEKNEELTMLLNKVNADIAHVKKQINTSMAKRDQLKADYVTYTRVLQETEQSLSKSNTDCTLKRNRLATIRTQSEREALEKRNLENSVMEKMMQHLTMDKASQYTRRAVDKVRKRSDELEITVAEVDNEISKILLQISEVTSRLRRLQQTLDEQNAALQQQNKFISQAEIEVKRNNALVERKQTQIDQINKKIDQSISAAGGEDLGPLELKIEGMRKQIVNSVDECNQMQQFWLRQQNELVKNIKSSNEQHKAIDSLEKQLLIMNQKKVRIDGQLSREKREQAQVEHNISSLQKDVVRLNTLITEKRGLQEQLEQGTVLMENDYVHALKDEELESIQLQEKVEMLKEEKERVLNSMIEAEQQIKLWDKKIKIAREMKESVNSDIGQAEVRAMKAEIHRMQVRHDRLMKQQEKMIQDMEKSVYRRESIILKGDAQAKCGQKEQTRGHLKKKIQDFQGQIKQTAKESIRMDEQLQELTSCEQALTQEMEKVHTDCQQIEATLDSIQAQVNYTEDHKIRGMSEFLLNQSKVKYLTAAKEGKYKLLSKSKEGRKSEWQRQLIKLQSLQVIVERLEVDFPTCGGQLRNFYLSIKSQLDNSSLQQPLNEVEVV